MGNSNSKHCGEHKTLKNDNIKGSSNRNSMSHNLDPSQKNPSIMQQKNHDFFLSFMQIPQEGQYEH